MKLAYLVSQYPAITHTFILREIRGLRARGFDIDVVSIRPPDRPLEQLTPEEREEAVRTESVKGAGVGKAVGAHLATLVRHPIGYLAGLAMAIRMGRFHPSASARHLFYFAEAVVAGSWMLSRRQKHFHTHFSSTVGLLMVRIFPLSMSITIHGPDEFNDPVGFHLAEKVAASKFVCTISDYGRSQLMRICDASLWDRIQVSRLGVDPSVFAPRPSRDIPEPFEILCVARLAPVKAQRVLIEAVGILVAQSRAVRLHFAGGGPDREDLERYVAQKGLRAQVEFHGALNQIQLRELYRRADAFALASFAEGVPVVLMEAMAMEIPCVATFITGIPELIRDGETGLLVPASDVEGFAAALARLVDDPALRQRLGAAGREKVLRDFDLDKNTSHLAEIFHRFLDVGPH